MIRVCCYKWLHARMPRKSHDGESAGQLALGGDLKLHKTCRRVTDKIRDAGGFLTNSPTCGWVFAKKKNPVIIKLWSPASHHMTCATTMSDTMCCVCNLKS